MTRREELLKGVDMTTDKKLKQTAKTASGTSSAALTSSAGKE